MKVFRKIISCQNVALLFIQKLWFCIGTALIAVLVNYKIKGESGSTRQNELTSFHLKSLLYLYDTFVVHVVIWFLINTGLSGHWARSLYDHYRSVGIKCVSAVTSRSG